MNAGAWRIVRDAGPADQLHRFVAPESPTRTVRILEPTDTALVLGSGQSHDDVDVDAAAAAGAGVVQRGSGGGAVLLAPGRQVWIDLWVPAGDRLRTDDVVRGADWVGDAWAEALSGLGFEVTVHRGPLVADGWAERICFLGRGPGEVFTDGRKVVGLSQRRTRDWLRVQTLVHREWDAATTVALLRGPRPSASDVAAMQRAVKGVGDRDVTTALLEALPV